MDIDIYILNLPRDIERRYVTEGALRAKGVPSSKIHIWEAKDNLNYGKTREVCEAAIADGFPIYQSFLDKGQHNECNIAFFSQAWSYCCFFRYLIDKQKIALLIHDDAMFGEGMTYQVLNEMVECLNNREEEFHYFTLRIKWYGVKDKINPKPIPENPHITRGIYSRNNDLAQVITPQGAELLLTKFAGYFPPYLEDFIFYQLKHYPGFYTILNEKPYNCENIRLHKSSIMDFDHPTEFYLRPIDTTRD